MITPPAASGTLVRFSSDNVCARASGSSSSRVFTRMRTSRRASRSPIVTPVSTPRPARAAMNRPMEERSAPAAAINSMSGSNTSSASPIGTSTSTSVQPGQRSISSFTRRAPSCMAS